MTKPEGRGEREIPKGHNREKLREKYMQALLTISQKKQALAQQEKDILTEAKNDGFRKTSLKDARKLLLMSEDSRQAKKEIDLETDEIYQACIASPLFKAAANAA